MSPSTPGYALNQLLTEQTIANGQTRTITYTYDNLGNILTRTEGTTRIENSYQYDRLTQTRTTKTVSSKALTLQVT